MAAIEHPKDLIPYKNIRDPRGGGRLPLIQSMAQINYDSFLTVFCLPTPPTTCLSNGSLINFDVDPNSFQMAENIVLRLNITCSNAAVTMVPSPWWFRTIKIRTNKGAGDYVKTWYPVESAWALSMEPPHIRDFYEREGMIRFIELKEELACCYAPPLNAGETRDVYIYLSPSFLEMNSWHGQHILQTIRFELEFNNDFVISGTATNITVNNISLLVRQHEMPESEQKEWIGDFKGNRHFYQYLDTMRLTDNGRTLTASSLTQYDLQTFIGKIPFLMVTVLPSTTPSASTHSSYRPVSVGESATWELYSPSQEPLLGKGNTITTSYLRREYFRLTGCKPLRNFYIFPFTDDIKSSWQGVASNYRAFTGAKETLGLTFGSAGTGEIHTWTNNGAATAGIWHVYWGGEYLARMVYNRPADDAESDIEASDYFTALGYNIEISAALNANGAKTVTFDAKDGWPSRDRCNQPLTLVGQALNDTDATCVITRRGIPGFVTGSGYQTEIYAFYFRRLEIDTRGVITTLTL
jgi:hypothetical protein